MTNLPTEIDKLIDEAFKFIRPVVKVKNGTGIMGMDSARLTLKQAIALELNKAKLKSAYAELRYIQKITDDISAFNSSVDYVIDMNKLYDRIREVQEQLFALQKEVES